MAEPLTFQSRDAATIRDGILRVLRNGLLARGYTNPNVTPGSDWFLLAQGVANELEVVEANAVIASDATMPDTAQDEDLIRWAANHGLELQSASGSSGTIILSSSAPTAVLTAAELVDGAGMRYRVTLGGTFDDGDAIAIESIDTGSETNLEEGSVIRWQSAPPFADEKSVVGLGGLVNGHDAEDLEGLRARLLAKLREPPRSGNWQHVAEIAEASSPSVQKAFVYPAIQGAGTEHIAVTAAPTATNKERDVASATMNGTIISYVQGQLPEHIYSVVTTVANAPTEVTFLLALPEALTASPPGPGGGWIDGTPWPDRGVTGQGCRVTAVSTTQVITVDAMAAPAAGVSHVAWLSTEDWIVRAARVTVVSVLSSAGDWTITLDAPLAGIAVGDFLWPQCERAQAYANAVLTSFAAMGPGEKTSNSSALIRGFRHPRSRTAWPYTLSSQMLREVIDSGAEITASQFAWRTDGSSSLTGTGGVLSPPVPVAVADPPYIFTPSKIGFYPLT